MVPRPVRWRVLERHALAVVVGVVAAWAVLVTALHVAVNHRGSLARPADTRPVEVGGLPVT